MRTLHGCGSSSSCSRQLLRRKPWDGGRPIRFLAWARSGFAGRKIEKMPGDELPRAALTHSRRSAGSPRGRPTLGHQGCRRRRRGSSSSSTSSSSSNNNNNNNSNSNSSSSCSSSSSSSSCLAALSSSGVLDYHRRRALRCRAQ